MKEGFNSTPYSREVYENKEREAARESVFPELVAAHILERVEDDLASAGFEGEELERVQKAFLSLSDVQMRAVLSVPAQLRPKLYEGYEKRITAGEMTPEEMVQDLLEKCERNSYTLGYHLSPREIKQNEKGDWVIKGTEPDHRNEDIPMAYYSLDYRSRYRQKPSKYLYVVRAELKDNSGHYRDNNGVWGRAPSLSVVDMINLPELEQEMDEYLKHTKNGGVANTKEAE